jgi:endoglucanase
MKKKFSIFFALILTFTLCSFKAPKDSPVFINGKLQVNGTQLCNQNGTPVVLAGVSFGWHNLWPRYYTSKAAQWLASNWKCNVIRASMGVGLDDSYLENPGFALQCITKVIDGALKSGIYVLIDFHSHKLHTAEAQIFFAQMAGKYKNNPNIIYEITSVPLKLGRY